MRPLQSLSDLGELILEGKPFLLYISTPTCQPCKRIRPLVEKNISPHITVVTVDMTTAGETLTTAIRDLGVNTVPKFFLSKGGEADLIELPNDVGVILEAVEAVLSNPNSLED